MDIGIKLQEAEGPLTPAGEGFPSRPPYHQGLIRVEMKTSLLEVCFSCVTVFVLFLIERDVLLPFHAAFGVLLGYTQVLVKSCVDARGFSLFLFSI